MNEESKEMHNITDNNIGENKFNDTQKKLAIIPEREEVNVDSWRPQPRTRDRNAAGEAEQKAIERLPPNIKKIFGFQ